MTRAQEHHDNELADRAANRGCKGQVSTQSKGWAATPPVDKISRILAVVPKDIRKGKAKGQGKAKAQPTENDSAKLEPKEKRESESEATSEVEGRAQGRGQGKAKAKAKA